MTLFLLIILMTITLMGIMAYFVIHSKNSIMRPLAVCVFLATLVVEPYAFFNFLGHPVVFYPPIFSLPDGEYDVVGFTAIPNDSIFVLLQPDPASPPVYYKLPWDEKQAQAMQDAKNQGYNSRMRVTRPKDDEGGTLFFDSPELDIIDPTTRRGTPKKEPGGDGIVRGQS